MQTPSPHPITDVAPWLLNPQPQILNLSALWQPTVIPPASTSVLSLPPLQALLISARLAELCEAILPEQPELLDELVEWGDVDAVVAVVERFLQQIGRLFPVHEELWDASLDYVEFFLYGIPVMPMGFDIWHDGWCELREPAPYLLHMTWSRDGTQEVYRSADEFDTLYPEYLVPYGLEPHRLINEIRQILAERAEQHLLPASPLTALPDFILMLNSDTGNVLLDFGESSLAESGNYPDWDIETVEWLTETWGEAEPILDGVLALMNWGENSAGGCDEKLTAVRTLLMEAHERRCANASINNGETDESTTDE